MAMFATVRQSTMAGTQNAGTISFGSAAPLGAGELWGLQPARKTQSSMDLDQQLVERCLAGEEYAWEDLVKAHTRRVYAICYRFTGTDHEAQDLTQDVFVRLFRSLKSYRVGEGSFVVWLSRLTRNLLIDHYRRTKLDRVTDSIEGQLPMLEEKTAGVGADGWYSRRAGSERGVAGGLAEIVARTTRGCDPARSRGDGVQGDRPGIERS